MEEAMMAFRIRIGEGLDRLHHMVAGVKIAGLASHPKWCNIGGSICF
jgi:hypothetical protein